MVLVLISFVFGYNDIQLVMQSNRYKLNYLYNMTNSVILKYILTMSTVFSVQSEDI